MTQPLSIAVIGAGIGGLSAASLLALQGHTVRLLDQFEEPAPVGSGLVIQPVGQQVLAHLGALERAVQGGHKVYRIDGYECDNGRKVLEAIYGPVEGSAFGLAIHRATLFDALMSVLPASVQIRSNARVTGREFDADGQHVTLEDGQKIGPFDLVVDASGAGSALSPLKSRSLGFGAVWGWVDWQETGLPKGRLHQIYRRADRMMGIMPIGTVPGETGMKTAIFWSLPANGHQTWRDAGLAAWRAEAAGYWPEFAQFAEQITDPDQMTMARYTHGTLRIPYGDGIAFIGDAAHRASPQLGQGANMALLDALALSEALRVSRADVALGLKYYADARRWHVRLYQVMSRIFTPQYQSHSRVLPVIRDRLFFPASQLAPARFILGHIVRGTMVPPLGSLPMDLRAPIS